MLLNPLGGGEGGLRYAEAHKKEKKKKHSLPDLEPIGFDRVMQSNLFILIPEAIRAPLMRTLFFLYIPHPNPRGSTQSISICMVELSSMFFFLRSVSLHYGYVHVCTEKKIHRD